MVILGWGWVGWGGAITAITFMSTCTHTSCYVMVIFSCTCTHTSCYAMVIFSCTCTHTSCYVMVIFSCTCTHTHTRHATLWLSWGGVGWGGAITAITFMSTCTDTSCYVGAMKSFWEEGKKFCISKKHELMSKNEVVLEIFKTLFFTSTW